MMNADQWATELDSSLSHRSQAQLAGLLQQVTDWFLAGGETMSEEHVAIFDDVMVRLVERIEHEALIELSERLAPLSNGPVKVIGQLSRNDDIAVSGPLLERSAVLSDHDLVEIAQTKGQNHLTAIAGRSTLSEMVTAVLFGRGNSDVARKVTANPGARISRHTYESLLKRARQDPDLTAAVATRKDLPQEVFEQLVREATETVRQRLLARTTPETRQRVSEVLTNVAARVSREPMPQALGGNARNLIPLDLARLRMRVMQAVKARQRSDIIEALAVLCQVPVKAVGDLIKLGSAEGLIVLGKAGGMSWPDLQEVLKVTVPAEAKSLAHLKGLFDKYASLSSPKAQIAVSYIRTSKAMTRNDINRLM